MLLNLIQDKVVRPALNKIIPGSGDVFIKARDLTPFGVFLKQQQRLQIEGAAIILKNWIIACRDQALKRKPAPVPPSIRSQVGSEFNQDLLDRAVYIVGGGDWWTLDNSAFDLGKKSAIVFDYVIVFRNKDATNNLKLWVHELVHVRQYSQWGIQGFARRYIQNSNDVEREAENVASKY